MKDASELADRLASEIKLVVQQDHVAAEVRVSPWDGTKGPFVEVRPNVESSAPPLSIHVLDKNSVAMTIGSDSTGEATGSPEKLIESARSLAHAMFVGNLSERVTRASGGQVFESKLLMTNQTGTKVVWTRSAAAPLSFKRRTHEVTTFAAYPPAS